MTITRHAAQRWIERVDPSLDMIGAYAAIKKHEKIIKLGISLGHSCHTRNRSPFGAVRLIRGHRGRQGLKNNLFRPSTRRS